MADNREPRISYQGLKVLRAFLDARAAGERLSGSDLMRSADILSGTMYPLLSRFESAGMLDSIWERQRPEDMGRPRRRLYRLTKTGESVARRVLEPLSITRG